LGGKGLRKHTHKGREIVVSHTPGEARKHAPVAMFGEALRPYEARKHTHKRFAGRGLGRGSLLAGL
jgi:hypothetical protein